MRPAPGRRAATDRIDQAETGLRPGLAVRAATDDGPNSYEGPMAKKSETNGDGRPVIVCTEHRGVFFGYAADTSGDVIHLRRARMAIYFGTTRGVMQLAESGPTSSSKISARADLEVRRITAVMEVTPAAVAAWETVK